MSLCQCKASGILFTCLAEVWQLLKSHTCVFSLCLENISRRMVNLLAEDTFKSFSLAIGVRSLLIVHVHGEGVGIYGTDIGHLPQGWTSQALCFQLLCVTP